MIEKLEESQKNGHKYSEQQFGIIEKSFNPALNKFKESHPQNIGGVKMEIDPGKQTAKKTHPVQ